MSKPLTATEVARRLGVDPSRVRQWCIAGELHGADKHGRDWIIPEESLAKLVRRPRGRKRKSKTA